MNKTDLLALADRLGTISPSEKSPEGLLADNLCLDISSFILRKLATVEPVAYALWLPGEKLPRLYHTTLEASHGAVSRWPDAYAGALHVPLYTSPPAAQADRLDAERYRWLRDNPWPGDLLQIIQFQRNALWDEAIDAAMSAQAGGKEQAS